MKRMTKSRLLGGFNLLFMPDRLFRSFLNILWIASTRNKQTRQVLKGPKPTGEPKIKSN